MDCGKMADSVVPLSFTFSFENIDTIKQRVLVVKVIAIFDYL